MSQDQNGNGGDERLQVPVNDDRPADPSVADDATKAADTPPPAVTINLDEDEGDDDGPPSTNGVKPWYMGKAALAVAAVILGGIGFVFYAAFGGSDEAVAPEKVASTDATDNEDDGDDAVVDDAVVDGGAGDESLVAVENCNYGFLPVVKSGQLFASQSQGFHGSGCPTELVKSPGDYCTATVDRMVCPVSDVTYVVAFDPDAIREKGIEVPQVAALSRLK